MSKRTLGFALLIIIIALPILFFPIGGDQTIYLLGGKTIAEGGEIYVDFIDLKQPLIYEMMAAVVAIFGFHEISIRIFDLIWQLATVASLLFIVKRVTGDDFKAFGSGAIYILLYSILNYSQTLQCEGFASLPTVWIIYLSTVNKEFKLSRYILIGGLIGFVIGLKYTFGIVLIAFAVDLFFRFNFKRGFIALIIAGASALVIFVLSYAALLIGDSFVGYANVLDYLWNYSSFQGYNLAVVKYALKSTGSFLGDNFSLAFITFSIAGLYKFFKADKEIDGLSFYRFAILLAIFLFVTIFIEKKFSPYHFSRIYLSAAIVGGWGVAVLSKKAKIIWGKAGLYRKLLLICFAAFAFVFSPIPRWIALLPGTYYYFADRSKYDDYYTRRDDYLFRKDYKAVGEIIRGKSKPNDKLTVVSVGTCTINYFSGLENLSKFGQSQFYYGKGTPDYWLKEFHKELEKSDWIVVQNNDRHPIITGSKHSSWESLKRDSVARSYVRKHFSLVDTVGPFYVFWRE